MVKAISSLNWPNLISIALISESIDSIEALQKLDSPKLVNLRIIQEKPFSVKSLRKLYAPSLIKYELRHNGQVCCSESHFLC